MSRLTDDPACRLLLTQHLSSSADAVGSEQRRDDRVVDRL
jgi:hypothetical protein